MDVKRKVVILNEIYTMYDQIITAKSIACKRGCDACCTANVTMTTLEAYFLCSNGTEQKKEAPVPRLWEKPPALRFQPRVTVNQMAEICMAGDTLPEEEADPSWGRCPGLEDHACTLYSVRPFGCRCMVSRRSCQSGGYADMDDFVLSVNTIFQQVIEHLDTGGFTGNFADVMECFSHPENMDRYEKNRLTGQQSGLLPNRPARILMVPPEHRESIAPILEKLQALVR